MRYLAGIFKLPYDPALCLTFLTRRRIASFFVSSMYRLEAYLFFASIANISSIFQYLDHSNMLFHPLPWGGETNTVQFHKSFVYRRALFAMGGDVYWAGPPQCGCKPSLMQRSRSRPKRQGHDWHWDYDRWNCTCDSGSYFVGRRDYTHPSLTNNLRL